jgi:hypothetical protein
MFDEAITKITSQQPAEHSPAWMVGEQLKDMLREQPECAELVLRDLDVKNMSITDCEKKIKEYADKHKSSDYSCVVPAEADRIIREFYGLPERGVHLSAAPDTEAPGKILDLADFF